MVVISEISPVVCVCAHMFFIAVRFLYACVFLPSSCFEQAFLQGTPLAFAYNLVPASLPYFAPH